MTLIQGIIIMAAVQAIFWGSAWFVAAWFNAVQRFRHDLNLMPKPQEDKAAAHAEELLEALVALAEAYRYGDATDPARHAVRREAWRKTDAAIAKATAHTGA